MSQDIDLGLIYESPRARRLDKANVDRLAASMAEVGLINPLVVRTVGRHIGTTPITAYEIVAGGHRYAAAVNLKWVTIRCDIVELDALHIELAEIDENLIRANLTPTQEAAAISRRKAIYEELHPETKHGGNKGPCAQFAHTGQESFADNTANATGKHRATIDRASARGEALGPHLAVIAGTSLDKGVELDALAKLPDAERKSLIDRAKSGENVSARPAKMAPEPLNEFETREYWMIYMMRGWNKGSAEWREQFLSRIDTPIFDRTRSA